MPNRWLGGASSYRNGPVDIRLIAEKRHSVGGVVILIPGLSFIFTHVNFMLSSRTGLLWATHKLLEGSIK